MRLHECLELGRLLQGDPDTEIQRIAYDSRQAGPGALFVAVPGFTTDGHEYVADAVARGAVAVAVERPVPAPPHVAILQVASSRRALSALSARLYGWPSRRIRAIGVTGTNGKTTTTHLIRAILREQGHKVGLIGTVRNFIGEEEHPALLTTPMASEVQELLYRMVEAGCTYVVMEVSSEGIDLHRVDDVEFDVACLTNLTQDHLNYHGTLEAYREAKLQLFRMLDPAGQKGSKYAVINCDDPSAEYFQEACRVPVHLYGLNPASHVHARDLDVTSAGSRFRMMTSQGELTISLLLAGKFNVYNALAAASVALAEGIDGETVKRALQQATGVTGRLEAIHAGQPFGVFVDYAHSPDGLENILRTAHGFARGRVIVVFGCGGDRDRTKRPLMGRIAAELADYSIVTSDNPRTEEPRAIMRDIEAGIRQVLAPNRFYELIEDRTEAIARAVQLAQPDDVILIAGKGHETYQIFRDRTIDFDDRLVARRLIEERLARQQSQGA